MLHSNNLRHKSLQGLIDSIDWITLKNNTAGRRSSSTDEVTIAYCKNNTADPKVNRVIIRFGKDVVDALGWTYGDKLVVMQNKDDLFQFLIVKSESGEGYKLGRDAKVSASMRIQFSWIHDIPLVKMNPKPVTYDLYKQYISFRAPTK